MVITLTCTIRRDELLDSSIRLAVHCPVFVTMICCGEAEPWFASISYTLLVIEGFNVRIFSSHVFGEWKSVAFDS